MIRHLIPPHGGKLVNLLADFPSVQKLKADSRDWQSWDLAPRQLCDFELLLNGGFSPLTGFMRQSDYDSVCSSMELADGTFWPIPVTLDVDHETANKLKIGERLVLRDPEGALLGLINVQELWQPDRLAEAEAVYGSTNEEHPGIDYLLNKTHPWYVGGRVEGLQLPEHFDFRASRLVPSELRNEFSRLGWRKVIAFQTKSPIHRAQYELTHRAVRDVGANLLIHPVVGMTKPGDVDHYTRVRCYQAVLNYYPKHAVKLALLPLAMRLAGPREALWHAIIAKNYGCTHLIAGRDHGGPGQDSAGNPFYGLYESQNALKDRVSDIGVEVVPFKKLVYVRDRDAYEPLEELEKGRQSLDIPVPELMARLADGREIPRWFTFNEVADELRRAYPPRFRQGFTVFFTGLSGAGKSTLAKALMANLLEIGGRPVTLLDGDIVRKNLSSELGFSKAHRDLNNRRIGFVASEITKNGGIALCAPIAPYESVRGEVRAEISPRGGFILVHVATPLDVCEQRDRKGLYAKARAGVIKEFTGISDPYEVPLDAEVVIDTTNCTPEEATQTLLLYLEREGYIGARVEDYKK